MEKQQSKTSIPVTPEGKFTPIIKLSPELEALDGIARRMYKLHEDEAKRADDAQDRFTSQAENFLHASNLAVKAALRAVQREAERE